MKFLPVLLALFLLTPRVHADAPPDAAAVEAAGRALIARVMPGHEAAFVVEAIPAEQGRDVYEIAGKDGKIVLRGNSAVAVASALKRYLADFCHADPGWHCGSQMALPDPLPAVTATVRAASPYQYRYDYNYCTYGYTFAWWDWARWEKELDDLALHGVNLALVNVGQEAVWADVLQEMGYTDAEARAWLTLPTHFPWQLMSNMQSYGGPVPADLIARRLELGRKIVDRMRELGIAPVEPGYYGIVPADFAKRFPDAKVHDQGKWGVWLDRPAMLDPADPLFDKMADAFYRAQKKKFGPAHYLSADPFHEGGSVEGIDLPAAGRTIAGAMERAYPGVTWVFQSWQANPRQAMLDALDKQHCLVLDLQCEEHENWRARKQFGNTPWLWCTIHDFGGNDMLSARLDRVAQGPAAALAEAGPDQGGFMRGIGCLAEGSDTHPVVWERFFEQGWRADAPDSGAWLDAYARRHYGADDPNAQHALRELSASAWNVGLGKTVDHDSAICARPSLDPWQRACPYKTTQSPYAEEGVVDAWRDLLAAAPACGRSDAFRYDVADVARQAMADLGTHYHQRIVRAFKAKDVAALKELGDKQLALLHDMDRLARTRPEFLLGTWIAEARAWGETPAEKDLCEWNARTLLTDWTVPESHTNYASRHWNGLLGDYYYTRWQMWLGALTKALADGHADAFDEKPVREKIRDWEYAWTERTEPYPTTPAGDTVAVAQELYDRWSPDAHRLANQWDGTPPKD